MKVLFLIVNLHAPDWLIPNQYNHGIASLSAVLKLHGHQTDLFLVVKEKQIELLIKHIAKYKPQIIGFSVTEFALGDIKRVAQIIKSNFPDIFIVCGGVYCVLNPSSVIRHRCFDAICIREGEYALLKLANNLENKKNIYNIANLWFRKNNKIIKNKIASLVDLDLLPHPDREIFHKRGLNSYQGSMYFRSSKEKGGVFFMCRGCPFDCSYCANHALKKIYGKGYCRFINPKKAIEQIAKAQKKYHYDYIVFWDDTFTLNKKWLNEFTNLYEKYIKIPFYCNARIGTFDDYMIRKLKSAGCYCVAFGLESGDEKFREKMLNKKITNKEIIEGVKSIKKAGMKAVTFNMIGLPLETAQKFLKTILLNAEVDCDTQLLAVFYPYKKTKLYDYCKNNRLIKKEVPKNFTEYEDTTLDLPYFPREDILYYFKEFHSLVNTLKLRNKSRSTIYKFYYDLLFKLHYVPPSSPFFSISKKLYSRLRKN